VACFTVLAHVEEHMWNFGPTPLVLDPNVRPTRLLMFIDIFLQPVIRLYAIPLLAFTGEEEEEEGVASKEDVELIDSMLR
jgi:hypothetical protein